MNIRFRLLLALGLMLFLVVIGVIGYSSIEHWDPLDSLYMTIITLTTVGFTEVRPLSDAGRVFTISFIILGIGSAGFALTTVFGYIFEGAMMQTLRERRMELFRKKMHNHHIICGFTAVGKEVSAELERQRIQHILIDKEPLSAFPATLKYTAFLSGDSLDEEVLRSAHIEHAQSLIAALGDNAANLFLVVTARQLNPSLKIITEASDDTTAKKLTRAGANLVITPYQIAGKKIAASLLKPRLITFLDVISNTDESSPLRIEEFIVSKHSSLVGMSLRDSNIGQKTGAVILAIVDAQGKARFNQSERSSLASLPLLENDCLIAMGSDEQIASLGKFIREHEKLFKFK